MPDQDFYNAIDLPAGIDKEYLFSLYENDYQYLEQIFSITLEQLEEDLDSFRQAHGAGNLVNLRKAVHKLKPSFGFVGLLKMQEGCRQFENLCQGAGSMEELDGKYKELSNNLIDSQAVIKAAYVQIKSYNAK